ncbi:MAG: WhiB family transcriptional regulator [Actinomycetota bacterium]|nr:WhiB family transcriptional regulator [Actinomycetota bacterium]MDA8358173.1 WhiB family transcriptional regulator [Actinomycetota bacterium]
MTTARQWTGVAAVLPSRVPAPCRVTGCTTEAASEAGLCSVHAADQERRRSALVAITLGRTLVAHDSDPSWRRRAACRGLDPALFFPEIGESAAAPKAVCAQCPVSRECLDFALVNAETEGIWGGTTPRARRPLRSALRQAS